MEYVIAQPAALDLAPGQTVTLQDSYVRGRAGLSVEISDCGTYVLLTPRVAAEMAQWLAGYARSHGHVVTGVS